MVDHHPVVSEIIRLCAEIDAAYQRSHTEGEAVHNHNQHHLLKIGQSLFDEGGAALLKEIAQKVAANPSGRYLETIEVPERPTSVVFGGQDGRTLFILTRRSLYAVQMSARR